MWNAVLVVTFGCLLMEEATSQGKAESLQFHGFLPIDKIRAPPPNGDNGPNDIYQYMPVRMPRLLDHQIVIYPHYYGFEYGKDPERKVYEIHSATELALKNKKDHSKKFHKQKQQKIHHQKKEKKFSSFKSQNFVASSNSPQAFQSKFVPSQPNPIMRPVFPPKFKTKSRNEPRNVIQHPSYPVPRMPQQISHQHQPNPSFRPRQTHPHFG